MSTPAITVEDIGLERAQAMLGNNNHNRPINVAFVARYAADMLEGRWQFTGDAIRLNGDGSLIDGQHRLSAIVKASETDPDITIRTLVISGLSTSAQDAMDHGKPRTAADQVAMRGISYGAIVGAMARLIIWFDSKETSLNDVRHSVIMSWVDQHPNVSEYPAKFWSTGTSHVRSKAAVAAAAYLIDRETTDPDSTEEFMGMLLGGIGLERGNPVLSFRNRLQVASSRNERIKNSDMLHLILRAWNAYRANEQMTKFPFRNRDGQPIRVTKVAS